MDPFIKWLKDQNLISRGDAVYVISDMFDLSKAYHEAGAKLDLNVLIDGLWDIVGPEGTLLFPTFNWDFCKGIGFDVLKTPCKTGALPKAALKRDDYVRTAHPLYSFAVKGRLTSEFTAIDPPNAFGKGTIFELLEKYDAKALAIGVSALSGFTYIHHVEKTVGVDFRYDKNFTADYTDRNGNTSVKTYSMYVRDLNLDPRHINGFEPLEKIMLDKGIIRREYYGNVMCSSLKVNDTTSVIKDDLLNNGAANMYTFAGADR